MPRREALPDELDPRIKEFTIRLRSLVDHGGLSVAALADRTGYSGTSWESYLDGRLLAPKGAVIALAEVTGADPVHLVTLWELAERARNQVETPHDPTVRTVVRTGTADADSGGAARNRQRLTMFLAGLGAILVGIAAVFLFTGQGDGKKNQGAATSPSPSPSVSASARTRLPPGVECVGASCDGKDAEATGCSSGDLAATVKAAAVGAVTLEVRYSRTCGTAWGRITGGAPGDQVRVVAGTVRRAAGIATAGDTIAYTPMVAVRDATEVKACAVLATGRTGCTN